MNLKDQWDKVCEAYLSEFCKRLGFDRTDADWIANRPGELAQIGDYFVGMDEMRLLVDNNIPEKVFREWYDYSLEVNEAEVKWHELEGFTTLTHISFESFSKGAPLPYSEEKLAKMRESTKSIQEAKQRFIDICRKEAKNSPF